MPKKPESTVTLTVENWKAIMEIIRLSCKSKEEDWVKWGNGINQTIQSGMTQIAELWRFSMIMGRFTNIMKFHKSSTQE